MIVLRQKEFARAIPREAVVRELERRGLAGKISSALGGVPKYISQDFKTVKNPGYARRVEEGWQKWQNQGKSLPGNYENMGIHQKINLKGTLKDIGSEKEELIATLSTGGKRLQPKPKKGADFKEQFYYNQPSMHHLDNHALAQARSKRWDDLPVLVR